MRIRVEEGVESQGLRGSRHSPRRADPHRLTDLETPEPERPRLLPRGDKRTYTCQHCGEPTTHIGNLLTAILSLAKAAGISKRMTHHILRHCNSTHNRENGAKDYEVMALLGQQSTKIHTIYTHADWQNIVAATARLGAAIGQDGLSAWLSAQRQQADSSDGTED